MSMLLAPTPTSPHRRPTDSGDHHRRILNLFERCTDISRLKQLHAFTLRTTSPRDNATLFLYGRILHLSSSFSVSGLNYAFRIFETIENPSSFMWNVLIRGCAHDVVRKEEAVMLYRQMVEVGTTGPDKHTFPFVLKACAYIFGLSEGKQVHCQILKHGLSSDVYVNNGLIHLYGSCGCLDLARNVFDEMPKRSVVSWNAMIDALVRAGEYESALALFREMQRRSFEPDGYTIQSVLKACACLGSLYLGIWTHVFLLRNCEFDASMDVLIKNSLIDMYCRCGSVEMAEQIFKGMQKRDVASWNAMILGFGSHGKAEKALESFNRMAKDKNFRPNGVTFVGILSACNHRGMVKEGLEYFNSMIEDYGIKPVLEHYGCIIDLLARAGNINKALDLAMSMPMKPDVVIWRSLLDACSNNNGGNVELSEEIAKRIFETQEEDEGGVYVMLSRVYESAKRWDEMGTIRKLMTDKGIRKEPGCSFVEINGVFHEFFSGDTSHPKRKKIYERLNVINEKLISLSSKP